VLTARRQPESWLITHVDRLCRIQRGIPPALFSVNSRSPITPASLFRRQWSIWVELEWSPCLSRQRRATGRCLDTRILAVLVFGR
jgi:hypothetical protein